MSCMSDVGGDKGGGLGVGFGSVYFVSGSCGSWSLSV